MGRSYFGKRIARELEKIQQGEASPEKRAELVDWFRTYKAKGHLREDEQVELEALLSEEPSIFPFGELVPKGWFKDLLHLVEDTESPKPFHLLSALCVVGSIIGRDVMIDRGTHVLGMAPSALLISPAGRGRRSTACDFMVYEIGTKAGLRVLADSFTYEGFGDALMSLPVPTCLVYAGEMAALIGKGSYGESIIPKLTDLLGKTSRFQWTTVKRGSVTFEKPCVNALFTTAPDWLVSNVPQVVFGGGLMRRFLVCVQERREKIVSWADPIDEVAKNDLIERLKVIGKRTGRFLRPEGEAFKWYDDWYQRHSKNVENGDIGDERMAPYLSTKHDHLLRMAALLTMAAGEPLVFTVAKLEQALRLLDWLESDIPKAYAAMALSPMAGAQQSIVRALEMSGGALDHSSLHKRVYRTVPLSSMFREVVESLIEMEVIQVAPSLGRRGKTYLLRRNLD